MNTKKIKLFLINDGFVDKYLNKYKNDFIQSIIKKDGVVDLVLNFNEGTKDKVEIFFKKYSKYIFPNKDLKILLYNLLVKNKLKIAFAESCTGGNIASSFVYDVEGASKCFIGSFVTYSNELKHDILKVSKRSLKEFGAVSLEVVEEMVKGSFDITNADIVAAISGITGPTGGTKEKPVGTICIAISLKNKFFDKGIIKLNGNRQSMIKYVTNLIYFLIWRRLNLNIPCFNDE